MRKNKMISEEKFEEYLKADETLKQMSKILKVPVNNLPDAIEKLENKNKSLKEEIVHLKAILNKND